MNRASGGPFGNASVTPSETIPDARVRSPGPSSCTNNTITLTYTVEVHSNGSPLNVEECQTLDTNFKL